MRGLERYRLRFGLTLYLMFDFQSSITSLVVYQVSQWNKIPSGQRPFMCTARPNWLSLSTTFFNKNACHKIPIPLYDILSLDEKNLTVRVEPMVSVGDITRYILKI